MDKHELLRSAGVFAGLDAATLEYLAEHMKEFRATAGQPIFLEGALAGSFFIIASGEITIAKRIGTKQEKVLSVLGPGSVFGEMAFFSDSPRTADATAKSDTVLAEIDHGDLLSLIVTQPVAGLHIVSGFMRVTMERLEQTSRELATIYQTGKLLASGSPLKEIIKGIRDELLRALPQADDAALFLHNEFNQEYEPVAAPAGLREIAETGALAGQLHNAGQGMIYDTPDEMSRYDALFSGAQSGVFSPIYIAGKLRGFILMWNLKQSNAFTDSHALLIASVAGQLAAAVENLRYQQEERDRRHLNDARQTYQF